jgi:hypothetical protein
MAEVDEYVEPLTGEEIVIDVCSQIATWLRRDCNLRDSDSYQGGYRGTVKLRLDLFGMDQVTVEVEIPVSLPLQVQNGDGTPDQVIDAELEIPAESSLNTVRERSDQPIPTLTNEGGQPVVKPRRYVRGDRKIQTQGGATGEEL